ncbi:hypothetical protein AVEN_13381-1 [Araneus ventricosus]|uniref:Uncharacterized protein n=1 Tax=Araneus ventricosus TaxID=182803 RepID=A0A4Y2G2T5_ARAVE|nr:hypothetical protein AVEN_186862-1 [Araneus ventricosus]GBM46970.1 hypothetical protein AVEN_13381-1 [Araneus ventricosus]
MVLFIQHPEDLTNTFGCTAYIAHLGVEHSDLEEARRHTYIRCKIEDKSSPRELLQKRARSVPRPNTINGVHYLTPTKLFFFSSLHFLRLTAVTVTRMLVA